MADVPDYVGTNEHGVHDPVDLILLDAGWKRLRQVSVQVGALMIVHGEGLVLAHRHDPAIAAEACT